MGGRPAVESAAPIVSKEVLAVMELEMVDIRAPETSPLIQHNFDIIAPAALRPPPPLVSAQLEVKDSPAVGWKLAEAPEPPPVTSPKPPVEQVAQPTAAAKVRTPKRPSAEPVQYPAQSKKVRPRSRIFFIAIINIINLKLQFLQIVNELAYGPDAQDDDLDSMLASFRDVPADWKTIGQNTLKRMAWFVFWTFSPLNEATFIFSNFQVLVGINLKLLFNIFSREKRTKMD